MFIGVTTMMRCEAAVSGRRPSWRLEPTGHISNKTDRQKTRNYKSGEVASNTSRYDVTDSLDEYRAMLSHSCAMLSATEQVFYPVQSAVDSI